MLSIVNKEHPMVKKWLDTLINKSDLIPQTTRMPIIYDTRDKCYRFSPIGVLFWLYRAIDPEKYSIAIVKEDGRAFNGGYKMCKMIVRSEKEIIKDGKKEMLPTEEITVTGLPRSILEDIGIKTGEIAIYYDKLSEQNQKLLLKKVEDISHMFAMLDEEGYESKEITKAHYAALMNVRGIFSYTKQSFYLSDFIILPQTSFKLIGKLIKMAADSSLEHATNHDIEALLKQKAANLDKPKKRKPKQLNAHP